MNKRRPLHTVLETEEYLRVAHELFSEAERFEVLLYLAANPMAGDLIPGTGGARKFRFALPGRGKSGGARVITYFAGDDIPVFLLTAYGKGAKANLSAAERGFLKAVLSQLADAYRKGRDARVKSRSKPH
jgi:hypothetical protein